MDVDAAGRTWLTNQRGQRLFVRPMPLPASHSGAARGTVIIVHGLGEHSGRWTEVAGWAHAKGLACVSFDHWDHGHSVPEGQAAPQAGCMRFDDLVDDTVLLIRTVVDGGQYPAPFALYGHSMGGLISAHVGLRLQQANGGASIDPLHAMVLSAPPVMRGRSVSWLTAKVAGVLGAVAPTLGVAGLDVSELSTVAEVNQAYRDDPLVVHTKVQAGMGSQLLQAGELLKGRLAEIKWPLYLFHGKDDAIVNIEGSQLLAREASSKRLEFREVEGARHETHNEPCGREVVDTALDWVLGIMHDD